MYGSCDTARRLLFYYPSIGTAFDSLGGSARVTVSNALAFKRRFPNVSVGVCGDRVSEPFELQGVTFHPATQIISEPALLGSFKSIVFATHLGPFEDLEPLANQYWFLDSHCWSLDSAALANLPKFTSLLARSEQHRVHLGNQILNRCQISVVVNGLDPIVEQPVPGVVRIPKSIMFSGAIVPHKRVHTLLEAFMQLCLEIPRVSLHLYGGGSLWLDTDEYETMLRQLQLPRVFFHGVRRFDEMAALYQSHDILCSPSELESFGMSSIEAQAHGCIPVLNDAGGARATIREGKTGFLYSPNTAETLLDTIREALSKSDRMRGSAQEFARATFSIHQTVGQLADVLDPYLQLR